MGEHAFEVVCKVIVMWCCLP